MMTPLFSDPYMDVVLQDGTLRLHWKPNTEQMSVEQFRLSLAGYAVDAAANDVSALLVDATDFRFDDPGAVESWRQAAVIPLYNRAGVKRMAYVVPSTVELPTARSASGTERFDTSYFHTSEEALTWLHA